MDIGQSIRFIREKKGIKQQEIADLIGMHRSNYSKVENSQRELSITALDKIAKFFGLTIDQLIHSNNELPEEVSSIDKSTMEQVKLIQDLDPDDKSMVYKMIDTLITKKKFKDFFQQQLAS